MHFHRQSIHFALFANRILNRRVHGLHHLRNGRAVRQFRHVAALKQRAVSRVRCAKREHVHGARLGEHGLNDVLMAFHQVELDFRVRLAKGLESALHHSMVILLDVQQRVRALAGIGVAAQDRHAVPGNQESIPA